MTPTGFDGLDVYYPDYKTAWSEAYCINERPLPSGRPTYSSMLACCKVSPVTGDTSDARASFSQHPTPLFFRRVQGSYGGQTSGKCLSMLNRPPTTSPTGVGGLDFYYPDYDTAWSIATCKNERPLPFLPGGRPVYDTMLECCKGACEFFVRSFEGISNTFDELSTSLL